MSIGKFFKREFGGKNQYIEAAAEAVAHGTLTSEALEHLHQIAGELGMSPQERTVADVKAIERIMTTTMNSHPISETDLQLFRSAMTLLHVDPAWVNPRINARLQQILLFQKIATGHIPALPADQVPLSLQLGEQAYLIVPCHIKQEKVVGRSFSGGSSSMSVRIARGVHYRMGGFSGHSYPITQEVVVSRGNLILTSMRAVYLGDKLGFNAPWSKVNEVEPFNNAVRFYFTNKANASTLLYDNSEFAGLVEAISAQLLK